MRPRNWISDNLSIVNKAGVLVPLVANTGQIMLDNVVEEQRRRGFPVRIILLKPRQVGWSTWSEALGFQYINSVARRSALVVSADIDSTDFVFRMSKTFQAHMPDHERRKTAASSRKEIVYADPHSSRFITQTAGKDVLGRGGTVHFLHCSEVAFWPKAKEGMTGLLQMVPTSVESTVIIESTANGVGGYFYDMFWQARDRFKSTNDYSGYLPVFFPWYKFDEYRIQVPKGFEMDEEESQLASEFGLDASQVFWRRLKIQELGGDDSLFKQEYPATALEAFQVAGNPVFTDRIINREKGRAAKNPRTCIFESDEVVDVHRSFNCWQVATLPRGGREYVIGVDTQESKLSDVQDIKSRLDSHGVVVMDRNSGEFVAIYHGQGPQRDLAVQVLNAGRMYNNAWIVPEIPHGMELLIYLRDQGYENLYQRQTHDEQYNVEDGENLGWRTSQITRRWLVEGFRTAMIENSLKVNFLPIIAEMETFCWDKQGKPVHRPGQHDDLLFGAMLALQGHLRLPLDPKPYESDETGDDIKIEKQKELSTVGAIDPGPWEEEVEDW